MPSGPVSATWPLMPGEHRNELELMHIQKAPTGLMKELGYDGQAADLRLVCQATSVPLLAQLSQDPVSYRGSDG